MLFLKGVHAERLDLTGFNTENAVCDYICQRNRTSEIKGKIAREVGRTRKRRYDSEDQNKFPDLQG